MDGMDSAPVAAKQELFTLVLTKEEARVLLEPAGEGGPQKLQQHLREQLAEGKTTVALNDPQLGRVVRHMADPGTGEFQTRLRKGLQRPLMEMLRRH